MFFSVDTPSLTHLNLDFSNFFRIHCQSECKLNEDSCLIARFEKSTKKCWLGSLANPALPGDFNLSQTFSEDGHIDVG
jgi:hypothetical protein